ncbi:hypothetical protein E7T09_16800 [Deinococcus sp. KSM4-11]|uniref:hypothetical protein n=1 Tax=Deinococcus sp. KSM4-11 TaxID=2568654 RepID=UPI0010A49516|nr:hypothetical protein [Deinococcus sp. KSM4-11]THF85606.1 hypothetical protein E7T09_16800 [Deinococcus sp. KSM4-11]
MNRILLPTILAALLASCAPSMTGISASPIREGQVWTVTVNDHVTTLTAGPTTSGSTGTVFNNGALHADGAASVKDTFAYSRKTELPAFMMVGQSRVQGAAQSAIWCIVRTPTDTLNAALPGLYREATPADYAKGEDAVLASVSDGMFEYVLDSSLAPVSPCTVTRIK